MLRPSFVPPPEIRRLRDVTRYRASLVAARTAEKQRAEKLLENAPLTELAGLIAVSCMRAWTLAATVRAHDHRWGWGAGSAVAGGFPIWCG
jgi:hypothetical protein